MSDKEAVVYRKNSPIINVCDTTTSSATTSVNTENKGQSSNELMTPDQHFPVPNRFHFDTGKDSHSSQDLFCLPNCFLNQFPPSGVFAGSEAHPQKVAHPHLNSNHVETLTAQTKHKRNHLDGVQKQHRKHQNTRPAGIKTKDKREREISYIHRSQHHRERQESESNNIRHSLHAKDEILRASFSDEDADDDDDVSDDGEPSPKVKRCRESVRKAGNDGKNTSLDAPTYVSDVMTSSARSKVPEEIRLRINSRERQRMHDLNSALDSLRQVMPYSSGPAVKKLSKMSTLLLARNYIVMLTKCVQDMKRLVQELSTNQRPPPPLPLPSILHEASISPSSLLPTNTSGLHIPTPLLHPATALQVQHHCLNSLSPTTCPCLQCLKKRQAANDVTSLLGWKPG